MTDRMLVGACVGGIVGVFAAGAAVAGDSVGAAAAAVLVGALGALIGMMIGGRRRDG